MHKAHFVSSICPLRQCVCTTSLPVPLFITFGFTAIDFTPGDLLHPAVAFWLLSVCVHGLYVFRNGSVTPGRCVFVGQCLHCFCSNWKKDGPRSEQYTRHSSSLFFFCAAPGRLHQSFILTVLLLYWLLKLPMTKINYLLISLP